VDPAKDARNVSRRSILASAAGAAFVPLDAIRAAAPATTAKPATALTAAQLKTLDAFCDRLVPSDENGPGARECGAANYIDRALADALSAEKRSVIEGLAALDAFANLSQGSAFAELSADKRDVVLTAVDTGNAAGFPNSRAFFSRIRRLTLEGTFGDPFYGGNRNFGGWDLIGYPGPRLAVSAEEQKMHVVIKATHRSAWNTPSNRGENRGH
jgi:gluconate 2-dehydrogenase gamma chain